MGYKDPDYVRRVDADTLDLYNPSSLQTLRIRRGVNTTYLYGRDVTAKNLYIYANDVDGTPSILMNQGAGVEINATAGANITLSTAGAGFVQFGAYTIGAATDSIGYVTIKDIGGTARKLMVQA
jgi:hypothetical protein